MGMWTVVPVDKGVLPQPLAVSLDTLDAALLGVATHLAQGRYMSKERANLEALEEHCSKDNHTLTCILSH